MKIQCWITLLFAATPMLAAEPHVFRAARLWPGDGPPIADAVLVVRDGKVVAAGSRANVAIPAGAVMHDLGDATIIPGLIAAETSLAERGRDDLHALTPHHRAIDGFDWYADFHDPLSGGVTTVQISPGSRRLMPGQGAVVKLFGSDHERRVLREVESLRVVLGEASRNPPRIYEPPVGAVSVDKPFEPSRPQLGANLPSTIAGVRATFAAARNAKGSQDPFLRAVAASGAARTPIRVTAPSASDVQAALTLAREFNLRLLLVTPPVAKDSLPVWKQRVDGVVLSTGIRPGAVGDSVGRAPVAAARELRAAGFRVALKPIDDSDLKEILYLAGLFTTHLAPVEALRLVTADAAALLGVADRVGTLAAGKDADFVVLTGEPFGLHTRVKTVFVDGEQAYSAKSGGSKVIRAGRVLTSNGELLANGSILIEDKSIRAVGREVSVPAGAEEKRFGEAVIVPGFIDMNSNLGMGGPIRSPIGLGTKLSERLIQGDPAVRTVRQSGITTVLLSGPAPSPVLAFKLLDRPRAVKEPVALRFALQGNLTSAGSSLRSALRSGKAYADSWTKYQADLAAYAKKKKEFDAAQAKAPPKKDDKKPEAPKEPEAPQTNSALDPYRALFAGDIPVLVEARREDAIRLAVTICRDEFNLRTALVGAEDAFRVAELLAAKSVTVVAGPDLVRTVDREEVNLPMALAVRSVPFAFQSNAAGGAGGLPTAVGFSVRKGLGGDDALRGLTATPAKFLSVNSGTIAAGKDADLVVLSGMPFEASTRVLAVMIDGEWVYRAE